MELTQKTQYYLTREAFIVDQVKLIAELKRLKALWGSDFYAIRGDALDYFIDKPERIKIVSKKVSTMFEV